MASFDAKQAAARLAAIHAAERTACVALAQAQTKIVALHAERDAILAAMRDAEKAQEETR